MTRSVPLSFWSHAVSCSLENSYAQKFGFDSAFLLSFIWSQHHSENRKARLPGFSTISLEPLASEPMLAGSQRIPTMRDYVGYWRPQKQEKQVWGTNISRGCDVASFSFPTLVQETMAEIIQTSKWDSESMEFAFEVFSNPHTWEVWSGAGVTEGVWFRKGSIGSLALADAN